MHVFQFNCFALEKQLISPRVHTDGSIDNPIPTTPEAVLVKGKEEQWKVLLIDDDPGIRKVLGITLEDAGCNVITAPDGKTGIELCEKESPHIVITDIHMPKMGGIEVIRRVKEMDPEKEVIIITAFSEIELAIQALQLDASDFIIKPISDEAIMVALKRAKDRYKTRKELRDYTALIEERWMETAEELAKMFLFQGILIENSIDGIIAGNKEGKVVVFSKSIEKMLGYTKDQVIEKKSLNDFFAPGESIRFYSKLASEDFGGKNRLFLFETALLSRTGIKIPCQVSAAVLFQEEEEIGLVCFFQDLSEVRRLTQQVEDQARAPSG